MSSSSKHIDNKVSFSLRALINYRKTITMSKLLKIEENERILLKLGKGLKNVNSLALLLNVSVKHPVVYYNSLTYSFHFQKVFNMTKKIGNATEAL